MKRRTAIFWSAAIPICLFLLLCFRQELTLWAKSAAFLDCTFHRLTGFLCPACGNTRAVLALLHGDILKSLGYNPMICVVIAALAALYAETLCAAFGKPIRILPRRNWLLYTVLALVLGYDIVRNFFPAITLCL